MKYFHSSILLMLSLLTLMISACSILPEAGSDDDYKKSRANPTLEEPPEISLPTQNSAYKIPEPETPMSENASGSAGVQMKRDGQIRWLSVPSSSEEVWASVLTFWNKDDVDLAESDARLKMLKTEWIESRAGIPTEGLKDLFKKAMGTDSDLALREQYSVRVEANGELSNLFLTHKGAVLTAGKNDTPRWELRQPEPEKAAEMLTKLQLFLSHPN